MRIPAKGIPDGPSGADVIPTKSLPISQRRNGVVFGPFAAIEAKMTELTGKLGSNGGTNP
jgi:hypothetical protein